MLGTGIYRVVVSSGLRERAPAWLSRWLSLALGIAVLTASCGYQVETRRTTPSPSVAVSALGTPSRLTPSPAVLPSPLNSMGRWLDLSPEYSSTPGRIDSPAQADRLPMPGLYGAIYTELPLAYDAAATRARQRDSQAKFVALQIEAQTLVYGEALGTGELVWTSLFFYSPLDDVLVEYQAVYDRNGTYHKLDVVPRTHEVSDGFDLVQSRAERKSLPPFADFRAAPPLREPWAKTTLEQAVHAAWTLAGRPTVLGLLIVASARAPYDFFIDIGAKPSTGPQTPSASIVVIGYEYYRENR